MKLSIKKTDNASCITNLIGGKFEKVLLVLRSFDFQLFNVIITAGLISSKKYSIDNFRLLWAYAGKKNHPLFSRSQIADTPKVLKPAVFIDLPR